MRSFVYAWPIGMERVLRSRQPAQRFYEWTEEVSSDDDDMWVEEEPVYEEIDALDW